MAKSKPIPKLTLRVLGYQEEDGGWAAHCLETDLVGFGASFEKALKELMDLTEMQVSFSVQKGQPGLLDHPAPPHIFDVYSRLVTEALRSYPNPIREDKYEFGSFQAPPPKRPKFNPAHA